MAKTFTLDGLEVRAVSVAGMETCIELPSLKTCFDIGHGHRSTARNHTVLFTHAHIDHMGGIGHHAATRSMLSMGPPTYVVPTAVVDGVAPQSGGGTLPDAKTGHRVAVHVVALECARHDAAVDDTLRDE